MPVANTSNISTIQILRSYANSTPLTLEDGQLAFSFKSNTLYIGSNTGSVIAISDQATANLARDLANTKVSKSGDRMTGPLQFFGPNFAIGEYDVVGGIDVWANNNTSHAQLNFANTNFAYVDGYEAALQTPNSQITVFATGNVEIFTSTDGSVTRDTWTFDTDGTLTVPGPISGLGESKLDFTTYGPNTAYLTTTNDDSTALFMGAMSAELYANTTVQIRTNTKGTSQDWTFGENGSLTFPDNTIQTTAYTPGGEIDEVARATANAAYFHANGSFLKANAGYNQANTGTILAQAAFDKANTGGTITGNVYISNNLSVANTITTNALNISTNTSNVSLTKGTGITSWNYSGKFKSIVSEESNPAGLFFSPDGLNMYVNGTTGDDVNQYTLSTAWDVSTATYVRVFSTAAQDSAPNDIFFKPDGLSMYIMGQTNDTVFQYTLSSAFDISTASYASKSFSVTTQEATPTGLWFKPDGTVMYIIGNTADTVFQYNLGTAWDVSTASYASISFSVASQESVPVQVNLSANGLTMWILGATGDDIGEYTLGTAWNVSTATFVNNLYVGFQDTTPNGLFIDSNADNRVYMVGNTNDTVYQYNTDTNSIVITTDVLNVNNNARIQGNLAVQSAAYVDGSATISGALSVGGSTSLSTTSISATLTGTSAISLDASATNTIRMGFSQTTGNLFIGGATQTGNITFGYSSVNQTANIANGTTAAGSTKVVNLGTSAGSGSNTRINIGPSTAGANGNVTFNPQTTVAIQNAHPSVSNTTGALTVLGGVGVSGNVNSDAVYSGGYFYRDGTSITNTANNASANTIITQGVDASQNVRIDYSNSAITIIQGVDVGQNNRMTISDGVNASQNVRLDYSNTAITIIQGVDVGQNSRMTIIEGVDVTQNTRLTVIEGTDVSQNARMTIADGVDASQNIRLDYSNTAITIIQGVDVTQNTNISNKLNLTGSLNQTVSGNVTISQDLIVTGNLIITGNINTQNVQQLAVADPLIVLGIGNYVSDTKDIGFAAHYNDGTNAHTGIIRDSGTKEYYIFQGYTPEVDALNNVIITDPTFRTANLNASYVKGNLISTTASVNGLDISSVWTTQNSRMTIIEGTDVGQNSRMTIIEGTDVSQNARMVIIEGVDVGQNTRMTISDGVNASQNVRIDYSNTAITIIQGVDASQNSRMSIIEGTDLSQNVRLDFSNTRMTIIEGTDVSQNVRLNFSNTRMDIADGVNASQNVRIDYSNTALTIVQGVDNSQNVRIDYSNTAITIIQGVDTSQNARMTIIEGVDVGQNTNISTVTALAQAAFNRANTEPDSQNYLANTIVVANSTGWLSNSNVFFISSNNTLLVISNTASTSNTTGALIVNGGLGVAGNTHSRTITTQSINLHSQFVSSGIYPAQPISFSVDNGSNQWLVGQVRGYVAAGVNNNTSNFPGGLAFYTKTVGGTTDSPTVRMVLDAFGNLGIGNTAPQGVLDVSNYYGARQFLVANTASAANYLQVSGNTAGNGPVISGQGSDTNVDVNITPKGTGSVRITPLSGGASGLVLNQDTSSTINSSRLFLDSSGGTVAILNAGGNTFGFATAATIGSATGTTQMRIAHQASADRYAQVSGGQSGVNAPGIGTAGGSEAFDIFSSSNSLRFWTAGKMSSQVAAMAHVSSSVNWIQFAGNTAGGGVVISGQGSDTNVGINLVPKGAGSVNVTSTLAATSNTTGALVVSGGLGVGNTIWASSGSTNGIRTPFGQIYDDGNFHIHGLAGNLWLNATGGGSVAINNQYNGNVLLTNGTGNVQVLSTQTSTSNTTGALVVSGGLGLSGNLSMNLATSSTGTTTTSRITLSQGNYIYCDDTTTGSIVFGGSRYYYFNAGIIYNGNSFVQRGTLYNDTGNNTVLFAGLSPVKIQNGTASSNTTTGALVVQGGVGISGALNATTKSFNIPHPTKEGKDLRYGSLEGPEFGVYVRGTLKGSNVIELPDYWTKLVDANTITVSLTPIGKYQKLSVKEIKDNTIIINSDGWFKKEIHCYYTVFGERADVDKLDVEG